jgi:hypothetical protein
LGLIRGNLAVNQGLTIALNVLVMNLEKLLSLLYVFVAALLHILLGSQSVWSVRTMPLKPKVAAA